MRLLEWGLDVKNGALCLSGVAGLGWALDWWLQIYSLILHGLWKWCPDRHWWALVLVILFLSTLSTHSCQFSKNYRNAWTPWMPLTSGRSPEDCLSIISLINFLYQTSTTLLKLDQVFSLFRQTKEENGSKHLLILGFSSTFLTH